MKKITCLLILMSSVFTAHAEGIDAERVYLGGGLSFNSLPGVGSSRGFQFFAGYEFAGRLNDDISTALEVGYMDSGNFDRINNNNKYNAAEGVWAAFVETVPVSNKVDILGRLGYDFGDDDGLLLGAGIQYKFNTKAAMRMEYVTREHVAGLQANVLFKF